MDEYCLLTILSICYSKSTVQFTQYLDSVWIQWFTQYFGLYLLDHISDSSEGEESHSESNDVESDSESDQERIIQQESSKPCIIVKIGICP